MKITKFIHSCLLVETNEKTVLFDPGSMSVAALDLSTINKLDNVIITHEHFDHFNIEFVKQIVDKFPNVQITSTQSVVTQLAEEHIVGESTPSKGLSFFNSPHEGSPPLINPPDQIGVHLLDTLTHPGDSLSFSETKSILALPVTAPWGSSVDAVNLALKLRPAFVLPIHDWHWKDEARAGMYERFDKIFKENDIRFFALETGISVEIGPP